MKSTIFTILLWVIGVTQQLAAQNAKHGQPFPAGVYMTFQSVENRTPDFLCQLEVITRNEFELNFKPGHLFIVQRPDNCLSLKQVKKMIAYSTGDSMYFRGAYIDQEFGFFATKFTGKYLPYYYPVTNSAEMNGIVFGASVMGGLIGAAVAYSMLQALHQEGNADTKLPVYFFDLDTKQTYPLNNSTFMALLRIYPELKQEYDAMDKEKITLDDYFDFLARMH